MMREEGGGWVDSSVSPTLTHSCHLPDIQTHITTKDQGDGQGGGSRTPYSTTSNPWTVVDGSTEGGGGGMMRGG